MSIHPSTSRLIKLTTHPSQFDVDPEPITWDTVDPTLRGPVVATVSKPGRRNAIGAHSGSYSVYRAVALAVKAAPPGFRPDFTNTLPPSPIGPHPQWSTPGAIVSLDCWGHMPQDIFAQRIASGDLDVRPTISVTKSHLVLPELKEALASGRLKYDGTGGLCDDGALSITKAAIEAVWHLPGVAKRLGVSETHLRRALYEQSAGMFPELVTRPDLLLFLPPFNGLTIYMMGDVDSIADESKPLTVRLHDESYDSELFGSHSSTGRAWLTFSIEECCKAAQAGGAGLIIYSRQEGNGLGEVSKFLVHNARASLGDSVDNFISQQQRVTGTADLRLVELAADPLLWLGVSKIDKFITGSLRKAEVVEAAGIRIVERLAIPHDRLSKAAAVEAEASNKLSVPASPTKKSKRQKTEDAAASAAAAAVCLSDPAAHRRVALTSHGGQFSVDPLPLKWGAPAAERGAVIATLAKPEARNAIGSHNGPYAIHRAVGIARGQLDASHSADLVHTEPCVKIGPHPSWFSQDGIVALDPWGALPSPGVGESAAARGVPAQPTIAISRAELKMSEIDEALEKGRLEIDGTVLREGGLLSCIKCAIEPVWYLPGIAKRFGLDESVLRTKLFEHTGGMFPELITRGDLKIFLPPIGGATALIFGDINSIPDETKPLTVRVHDECNGSDVFGSDICTCRPYLLHGIEESIKSAQAGGAGIIVYNRKEGRALGEVTKFMVYNARKRQEGGDTAQNYFKRTQAIAGVEDMRFQELMPDPLLWLGVTKIDRFISMSDMKYDAIISSGIKIIERVDIPDDLIPADAKVEIDAKVFAGYFAGSKKKKTFEELQGTVGRAGGY